MKLTTTATQRKLIVVATFFFLAVNSAIYVRAGMTGHLTGLDALGLGFCANCFFLMLLLNSLLGISSRPRAIYITLITLIIISFVISYPCGEWRINTLRNKFLNEKLPVYDSIISNTNQPLIGRTGDFHPLTRIGRLDILSKIDEDGASVIFFADDEDWFHGGYMYYDGHQLIPRKDKPNEYVFPPDGPSSRVFLHITNDWYEFNK